MPSGVPNWTALSGAWRALGITLDKYSVRFVIQVECSKAWIVQEKWLHFINLNLHLRYMDNL